MCAAGSQPLVSNAVQCNMFLVLIVYQADRIHCWLPLSLFTCTDKMMENNKSSIVISTCLRIGFRYLLFAFNIQWIVNLLFAFDVYKYFSPSSHLYQKERDQWWWWANRCLADIDVDGNLAADEFCVAMYLIDMAKKGQPLPTTLPPGLIPPSMQRLRRASETVTSVQLPCKFFLWDTI